MLFSQFLKHTLSRSSSCSLNFTSFVCTFLSLLFSVPFSVAIRYHVNHWHIPFHHTTKVCASFEVGIRTSTQDLREIPAISYHAGTLQVAFVIVAIRNLVLCNSWYIAEQALTESNLQMCKCPVVNLFLHSGSINLHHISVFLAKVKRYCKKLLQNYCMSDIHLHTCIHKRVHKCTHVYS